MSVFQAIDVPCPACATSVKFNAVFSVNADRRQDLRLAILDRSFQRQPCPKCAAPFRLDPELTYVDLGRNQWIAAFPADKVDQWPDLEARSRDTFNRAYGAQAPAAARQLGAGLKPRLVFGWPALREKIFAGEEKLDDVNLELMKIAMIRGSDKSPLAQDTELRLVGTAKDNLVMAWLRPVSEEVVQLLDVPRSLFDEIAADRKGWEPLRKSLTGGLYVDVLRLMVEAV